MKTLIDFIYTLLISAAVALFVGLGIWTFYSGPTMPQYPDYNTPSLESPSDSENKAFQVRQADFDKKMKQYDKDRKVYNKKVAAIAVGAAVVFYLIGVVLMRIRRVTDVIGEGLALGGVFTTVYAAIVAATASFKQLVFASVTLLLVMLIVLAHNRMRAPSAVKPKHSAA